MMRCVVVCGLLLGGLQFSTAPSITFCVAVKLSGTSITAQSLATGSSEHKPKREVEAADTLPIEETKLQSCYKEFVKEKYGGDAVENVPGVQLPLPRWDWLDQEIQEGYQVIEDWDEVKIHRLLPLQALSPCTRNGLEFAIRQKFEKQLVNELDESQKTVIYLLIKAGFNSRPESPKKRGFEKFKHKLSNFFTPCDKSSGLWEYLKNFVMWEEEKEDICRQVTTL